jgi:hypothetical protein
MSELVVCEWYLNKAVKKQTCKGGKEGTGPGTSLSLSLISS